ncbi:MAG: hypothetical protein AAF497_01715, partial [Planctomycetota bacterium]
ENMSLNANQFDNTISVQRFGSLFDDPVLTIDAEDGDDELILGEGLGRTSFIYDEVRFQGGEGADRILVDDSANGSSQTYTLTASELDLGGVLGRLRHWQTEEIVIDSGPGNDTFLVDSSREGIEMMLNGEAGSDRFVIAAPTGNIGDTRASVLIDGGVSTNGNLETDEVEIHDASYDGNGNYSILRSSAGTATLSRIDNSPIRVSSVERTSLFAGKGDNVINVDGFIPTVELVVDAGNGTDTIKVTPTIVSPGTSVGQILVSGGLDSNNDSLNILDEAAQNVGPYLITDESVERSDAMPVAYVDIEQLRLSVDRGANMVTVASTSADTAVSIETGAGDDEVQIDSFSSTVRVNAGSNGSSGDQLSLLGSNQTDAFHLVGESNTLGGSQVLTDGVEQRIIDGLEGDDRLFVRGVGQVDEAFHLRPIEGQLNTAELTTGVFSDVVLVDVAKVRVAGNSVDNDTLVFSGSSDDDHFDINLSANGTAADPFLVYSRPLGDSLTLMGYFRVVTPEIRGLAGNDQFDVHINDAGPAGGRSIRIDGGSSIPGRVSGDRLNLFYPSSGSLNHVPDDEDTGTIEVAFSTRQFEIDYDNIDDLTL